MQKKQKVAIALVVLFLFVVVGSYTIVGTYAKYTSTLTGNGEATVAKWNWEIDGNAFPSEATFAWDLFKDSTLLDSNCSEVAGEEESDVAATRTEGETTKKIIAPGTCGKFEIDVTNNSEVNAKYAYELALTNASNIPLEFSTDGTNWSSFADFTAKSKAATPINMDAGSQKIATIYWKWAYDRADGNDKDTTLGLDGTATAKITSTLTLEQVD